jgi:hypothetical protein
MKKLMIAILILTGAAMAQIPDETKGLDIASDAFLYCSILGVASDALSHFKSVTSKLSYNYTLSSKVNWNSPLAVGVHNEIAREDIDAHGWGNSWSGVEHNINNMDKPTRQVYLENIHASCPLLSAKYENDIKTMRVLLPAMMAQQKQYKAIQADNE